MEKNVAMIQRESSGHGAHRWLTLATVCLAQFIVVLSFQGASLIVPEVQQEFSLPATTTQWLISANALAFGGLLLAAGRAADHFGHRRLFATGLALFAMATLAAGLAPSAEWLIVARAIQGAGTALFAPASIALLAGAFPEGSTRHRALAAWGAAGPLGGVVAVLLGGVLAGWLGWRAVLIVAAPVALFCLGLTVFGIRDDSARSTGRLDPWSTLAGTAGAALLIYGFSDLAQVGLTSATPATTIFFGVVLLAGFVMAERRSSAPLIPGALIGQGRLIASVAVAFLLGGATNTSLVFFALYMQEARGASLLATGAGFVPCNVAIMAGSMLAGRFINRRGFGPVTAMGMAAITLGLLTLTTMTVDSEYARTLLPGLALVGLGLGLAQVGVVGAAAATAAHHDQGVAAGLISMAGQIGTAVGLALLVALAGRVEGMADPEHIVASVRTAYLGAAALALLGLGVALYGMWRRRTPLPQPAPVMPQRDCPEAAQ